MVGWFTGGGGGGERERPQQKGEFWRRATRAGRPEPKGRAGRSSSGGVLCPTLDSPRRALHLRRCANSRPSRAVRRLHTKISGPTNRAISDGFRQCGGTPPCLSLRRRNDLHAPSRPLFRNAGSLESSVTQGSLSSIQIAFSGAKPAGSSSDAIVTSIHSAVVDSRKKRCVPQHAAKDRSRSA
jgi:hypothetical protein